MKKMNNKGFSLVELIIVIAIMAILIAVLAPQYIKYVEKSRKSADLDNYQAIIDAVQVVYADTDLEPASLTRTGTFTITCASTGVTTTDTLIGPQLASLGVSLGNIRMKSNDYAGAVLTISLGDTMRISCDKPTLAKELGLTN